MLLAAPPIPHLDADRLACLRALERKVLWLSTWMIHNANHLRPSRDGLKVGGHQASSASVATLMTALYLDVMQPQDRVAVKPHAAPVFHALQYLLGRQSRDKLERFRAFGGAQSYPSRTKDGDIVDFSTGSVGLVFDFPLTIAFADADGRVAAVLDMEPCPYETCPTYRPGVTYRMALEVNQGALAGVAPGWRIEAEGELPPAS